MSKSLAWISPFISNFCTGLAAFRGDFGYSFKSGAPVIEEFKDRFPYTLLLVFGATLVYLVIGTVIGILSALYRDTVIDHLVRAFAAINLSMPNFWLALLLLWFISLRMRLLPAFGFQGLSSLILPSLALGLGMAGAYSRVLRACMLEALSSDYVITAKAKGLSYWSVITGHVLKNAFLPVITMIGINITNLLGGTVIIESIFGLPGIGSYLVEAINIKDYPVISGFTLAFGVMIILINTLVDISYTLLDPRVRYEYGD